MRPAVDAGSNPAAARARISAAAWLRRALDKIGLRPSSLSARYLLVSLLAAIVPLAATVVLYDRYASELVTRLAGQRVESGLTATGSKLADYLRTKSYQLEALTDLPQLARIAGADVNALDARAQAMLRLEADSQDVYGVFFLDRADRLERLRIGNYSGL